MTEPFKNSEQFQDHAAKQAIYELSRRLWTAPFLQAQAKKESAMKAKAKSDSLEK